MSEQVLKSPVILHEAGANKIADGVASSYLPFILAMAGSFVLAGARIGIGGNGFISDGALMMLGLASYCFAAVFYLTNFYAPFRFAEKMGLWAATLGVFFNFSSWLVRWVASYDRELAIFQSQGRSAEDMDWIWRYVPFSNLYDMSLTFAFGAGVTTLLVMRRKDLRMIAALSLPLAAIILVLARFIGSEIVDLPPVLNSYWRPIHVGVAALSYGIGLVCFAVAVLYLLKDGLKVEKMSIWASIFALAVFTTISKFSVFAPGTFGTYGASTFIGDARSPIALRADLPYVGWFIVASAVLLVGAIAAFLAHISKNDDRSSRIGFGLLGASLLTQIGGVAMLVYQVKAIKSVISYIDPQQYERFAVWMLQQQDVPAAQIASIPKAQLVQMSAGWVTENADKLRLSLNANPVELSALITAFIGVFFVFLFSIKTERIREALPAAETLDGVMYKLGGITFAGLALLLITGAIWANESWGRYWGWDAKETGALVAWFTYAGFLHSRIAYGWRGRSSAYFALIAFLFVVFTYLGVSYLLPGLHSYA